MVEVAKRSKNGIKMDYKKMKEFENELDLVYNDLIHNEISVKKSQLILSEKYEKLTDAEREFLKISAIESLIKSLK